MAGKVYFDISMSLDGFITGPNQSIENPLGEGGDRLHQWAYELESWRRPHGLAGGESNRDAEILDEAFQSAGAIVMGRRMFDHAEAPWGDSPPFHMPVFVLTHRPRDVLVKEGGTTFTFVTEGPENALAQARAAAGDKGVSIAGGAETARQFLGAGLVDELQIHIVPLLLGAGVRLFEHMGTKSIELERSRVVGSPQVTHLRYRVVK